MKIQNAKWLLSTTSNGIGLCPLTKLGTTSSSNVPGTLYLVQDRCRSAFEVHCKHAGVGSEL